MNIDIIVWVTPMNDVKNKQYLTKPMTSSVQLKANPKLNADRKRKFFQRRGTCSTPNSGSNDSSLEGIAIAVGR